MRTNLVPPRKAAKRLERVPGMEERLPLDRVTSAPISSVPRLEDAWELPPPEMRSLFLAERLFAGGKPGLEEEADAPGLTASFSREEVSVPSGFCSSGIGASGPAKYSSAEPGCPA